MGCDRFADRLTAAARGALDPADMADLAAHLDVCEACRAALATEQRIALAWAATPAIRPSRALQQALLAVPAHERRRRRLVPLMLPLAMLLCLFGSAVTWLALPFARPGEVAVATAPAGRDGAGRATGTPLSKGSAHPTPTVSRGDGERAADAAVADTAITGATPPHIPRMAPVAAPRARRRHTGGDCRADARRRDRGDGQAQGPRARGGAAGRHGPRPTDGSLADAGGRSEQGPDVAWNAAAGRHRAARADERGAHAHPADRDARRRSARHNTRPADGHAGRADADPGRLGPADPHPHPAGTGAAVAHAGAALADRPARDRPAAGPDGDRFPGCAAIHAHGGADGITDASRAADRPANADRLDHTDGHGIPDADGDGDAADRHAGALGARESQQALGASGVQSPRQALDQPSGGRAAGPRGRSAGRPACARARAAALSSRARISSIISRSRRSAKVSRGRRSR